MKLWIAVFVSYSTVLMNNHVGAQDCTKIPKESSFSVEACCAFPNVSDLAIEKKVAELAQKAGPTIKDSLGFACKVAQTIFTELNIFKDNVCDKDGFSKMLDAKLTKDNEYWKQPLKDSFEQCHKTFLADSSKLAEIFSKAPYNIKKEDCDPQPLVMFMCLHFDSLVNCPEKAWKVTEKNSNYKSCMNAKTWLGKCGKDINTIEKIMMEAHTKR